MRDVERLQAMAAAHGPAVGTYRGSLGAMKAAVIGDTVEWAPPTALPEPQSVIHWGEPVGSLRE